MSQTPPNPYGEPGDASSEQTQPVQPGTSIPPPASPYPSYPSYPSGQEPQVDLTKPQPTSYQQPAPPVPYGAPQPIAYGQPAYPAYVPDHRQATTVLILGILGLVLCSILAPFAWVMGNRVVREIDASQGQVGGRSSANAGRICGIIGTVLMGLGLLFFLGIIVLAIAGASTSP